MPTFSIIVPIYNVEKYIIQCLESVLTQTFKDFEILCVDDCGKDKSIEIVEKYQKKDSRIKILKHKKNRGLSAARNTALEVAQGKYIVCLDSDDWLEPNCLEILNKTFTERKTTSVFFDAYRFNEDFQEREEKKILNNKCGYLEITPQNICKCSDYSWIKAYTTDSIKNNNLKWPEGLTFEDGEFYFEYFSLNPKTYVLEDALYNYRVREDSIVTNAQKGKLKIEDIYQIVKNIRKFYIDRGLYEKYKCALLQLLQLRINTCKNILNNYDKSLQLSRELLEEFEYPQQFNKFNHETTPKFSVIVPIYNVERYIEQCIKSIQNQTLSDIEILCVDDCGKDNSIQIVKNLQKDDKRIKIIHHKKNKGLGAARNTGLKEAQGEFILVVDSDDWLERTCLQSVYEKFIETSFNTIWFKGDIYWEDLKRQTNMCIFEHYANYPEGNLELTCENLMDFPQYSWCRAYRRDFLAENKLKWPEGIFFEDMEFYVKIFTKSPLTYVIDKSLYIYRRRGDSIIGNCIADPESAKHVFKASRKVYEYLKKSKLLSKYKNTYLKYVCDCINMFRSYPNIQTQLYSEISEYLKEIHYPEEYIKN
ncbi:glycosyltransferase family 2 protein [bacterium]|nr:glycosyltransferase family 2 protein [bacterium]